jgi:membrane-associated phospholipid phosphatase
VRRRRSRAARVRAGTVLAASTVAVSLLGVRGGALDDADRRLGALLARPRGRTVDRLMGVGTDLGSIYGLAGLSATLAVTGHRRAARDLVLSGGLAWCVAQGAKPLVGRPRPYQSIGAQRLVAEPAGSSWPSGHTAVAAAMAATLAPSLPPGPRAASTLAATGVACSRLYVGVHHPTDVAAGAGIGVLCARAVTRLGARRTRRRGRPLRR